MHAISLTFQRCKEAADNVRQNFKTYLITAVGLAAIAAAAYITSHLEEEQTFRYGGGRVLASPMAEPAVKMIDPTPYLRRLSTMIQHSNI
jgi:hypothetical protein